ncbi:MAG: TetR/AcrR family transcriptional regulator [Syntrophomonas sp.]
MKARIMQTARKEIKRYGLRRFTMDDVAAHLAISKKTLYKFFTSKGELIHEILKSDLEKEKEILQEAITNEGNWFDKLSAVFTLSGQNRVISDLEQEIQIYFPEEQKEINDFREFQKEIIGQLLAEGFAKGEIEPWFDVDNLLTIILELIQISNKELVQPDENGPSKNLLEEIKKLIFFGLIKRTW